MNTKTQTSRFQVLSIVATAVAIPAILGVQQWLEDPAHGLVFLLARFFVVAGLSAAVSAAVGFAALRFMIKK